MSATNTVMPTPNCPPWCPGDHEGFNATVSFGSIACEHRVTRGDVTFGVIEYLEPDGSREMTTLSLDLPNSAGDYVAATSTELAADLRGLITDLSALLAVLDGAVERTTSANLAEVVAGDGQSPRPEPVAVSRGGVTVGWRWPDGSRVEWDDDGNPVRSPQHGGHVEP